MIMFDCPACKTKLRVGDQHGGKTIQCPKCKEKTIVPANDVTEAEAITEEPKAALPSAADEAVTTPEQMKAAKRPSADRASDEDDDAEKEPEEEDRPRRGKRRDHDDSDAPAKKGMGTAAIVMIVVGVSGCCLVTVGVVLVALLVPAVSKVREAAARAQSTNNLKQISLAMHGFHDANKRLPFNGTKQAVAGDPTSGSWAFQILPYINQAPMYNSLDRISPVPTYMNPARGRPMVETSNGGGAWTDYFYNNYLNGSYQAADPKAPDFKRTMVGITDGTSNTIFAGEGNISTTQYPQTGNVTLSTNIFVGGTTGTMRAGNSVPKGQQMGPNPGITLMRDSAMNPNIGSWGGPYPQGALMGMCDATVRLFPYNTPNFGHFLTPDGGEPVRLPDF